MVAQVSEELPPRDIAEALKRETIMVRKQHDLTLTISGTDKIFSALRSERHAQETGN